MKWSFLVYLSILSMMAGVCTASPVYWPGSGHWYELTSGPMTWTAAQNEALSKGGYLVTIADPAEQAFVATTFAPSGGWDKFVWIGLWDALGDRNFVWVTGEPVLYTNWGPNEPNNLSQPAPPSIEWAVHLWTVNPFGGWWNDVSGENDFYGVIEYDTLIPEPATLLFVGSGLIGLSLIRRRLARS